MTGERAGEAMEPSKEAIEAAKATGWTTQLGYQDTLIEDSKRNVIDLERVLKAAYAIDLDAHQQAMQGLQAENERLKEVLAGKPVLQTAWEQLIDERERLQAEVERLQQQLSIERKDKDSWFTSYQAKFKEADERVAELMEKINHNRQQLADQRVEIDEATKQRDLWQQKASDLLQGPHVIISQEAFNERKAAMQGLLRALEKLKAGWYAQLVSFFGESEENRVSFEALPEVLAANAALAAAAKLE